MLRDLDYFGQDDGMATHFASCRTQACGRGYGGGRSRVDTDMKTAEGLDSELVPSYFGHALLGRADCKRKAYTCHLVSDNSYRVI